MKEYWINVYTWPGTDNYIGAEWDTRIMADTAMICMPDAKVIYRIHVRLK